MTNEHPADSLGYVRAQIADLKKQEAKFHAQLVAMGELVEGDDGILRATHEGDTFRATITVGPRTVYDNEAIRAKCSVQLVTAHTSYTSTTTVRTVSRNGKGV